MYQTNPNDCLSLLRTQAIIMDIQDVFYKYTHDVHLTMTLNVHDVHLTMTFTEIEKKRSSKSTRQVNLTPIFIKKKKENYY